MKETVGDWEVLRDSLGSQLDAFPFLAADHEALKALILEAKALETQRELERSALRDTNHKRAEAVKRGRELTGRIGTMLRGSFGPVSEKLIEFGLKPRPREIRRRFLSKAEKAQILAEKAASAAAAAAAEAKLKEALKQVGENGLSVHLAAG